jgi:hypothetical protein
MTSSPNERLGKLVPYFIPACIFLGILKLLIFYNSFSIDIVYYIGFSEILMSFLNNLWLYIIMIIAPILLYFLFFRNDGQSQTQRFTERLGLTTRQRFKLAFTQNSFTDFLAFISMFPLFVMALFFPFLFRYLAIAVSQLAFGFLMNEWRVIKIKSGRDVDYLVQAIAIGSSFIVMLVIGVAFFETDTVKFGKYNRTKVVFKDTTVIADANNIFVGKTENFIFFYNPISKAPIIYKSSDLVRIEYHIGKYNLGLLKPYLPHQ